MTTSTAIISTIITKQIAYMTAKADTAECYGAVLKIIHADSNEDMQADTKINYGRKNVTCVGNLDAG
jgi:hypothetical protein